jgi:hypothetical protein
MEGKEHIKKNLKGVPASPRLGASLVPVGSLFSYQPGLKDFLSRLLDPGLKARTISPELAVPVGKPG